MELSFSVLKKKHCYFQFKTIETNLYKIQKRIKDEFLDDERATDSKLQLEACSVKELNSTYYAVVTYIHCGK